MKSKLNPGLVALALMSMFATSTFAQIQITVTNSAPSPAEIVTNLHASTSDTSAIGNGILVSGSLLAQSDLTATNLILTFPAPVTSSALHAPPTTEVTDSPTSDAVRITGATGVFSTVSISTINYVTGAVTLTLPATVANTASGSFRLSGVRISAAGKSGAQSGTVALSSSANNYILNTTTFSLINALSPGIASLAVGARTGGVDNGSAMLFNNQTTGTYADANASFVITEGFASAWKSAVQSSTSGNPLENGTQIRVTLANLPSGTTATLTLNPPTGLTAFFTPCGYTPVVTALTASLSSTTPGTTNLTCIDFANANTGVAEALQVDVTLSGTPTSVLTAGTAITATVTMAPVDTVPTGVMNPNSVNGYPRFVVSNVVATIGSIVSVNTTMLVPYFAKGFGVYDFGLAVSNTTADPFTPSGGGALATDGAVTFTVYLRGVATPITLSTATLTSTQVSGIVAGKVPAGGVLTGSLSQMLPATAPTDAVGYIFIQADFLNAHGIGYLIETSPSYHITSAVPMLVLSSPNLVPRIGPTEALGF